MRSVLISMLAVLGMAVMADASAIPVVSVQTTTPTVSVGDSVVVNVDITGVSDLYGFQLDLEFDPTLLSFTGGTSTEGAFLPSGGTTFFFGGTDNGAGAVAGTADTLIGPIPGVSGNGTLTTFDFTAVGAGVSPLTLANVLLVDSSANLLEFATAAGSVTVQRGTSVPEPATLFLLGAGLAGLGVVGGRKEARVPSSRLRS